MSVLVLILGLANLARMGMALYYVARLPDLTMTVSWAYLAAIGGFWGAIFVVCTVGLAGFRRWGHWATLIATSLYEMHTWINHLLFDANDYALQTWPRDMVLSLLLLALVWGTLSWPSIRKEFKQ